MMERERVAIALAIVLYIVRITFADDADIEPQSQQPYLYQSVELSFWVALGLATAVIFTCLCCIFCCKRESLIPHASSVTVQTAGGEGNEGFDYTDPPPDYSDVQKYALSKDEEGLPAYSEAYL